MATPEKLVKTKVKALLDERGAYHFSPMTHGFGHSGVADIVALYHGHWMSIELKADSTKKPTALQTKHAREVALQGGNVLLIHKDNIDQLKKTLDLMKIASNLNETAEQTVLWPDLSNQLGGLMPRPAKYTRESVATLIKQEGLGTRGELQKFNPSAYAAARKLGLLDEFFPKDGGTQTRKRNPAAKTKAATKTTTPKKRATKSKGSKGQVAVVTLGGISEVNVLADILNIAKVNNLTVEHTFEDAA